MPVAILFSGDLFIRSQVEAQVAPDLELHQVAQASALETQCTELEPSWLLIDLGGPPLDWTAIMRVRESRPGLKVAAFGPHVQTARLAEAKEAGCDLVLTRGQMLKEGGQRLRAWDREDA